MIIYLDSYKKLFVPYSEIKDDLKDLEKETSSAIEASEKESLPAEKRSIQIASYFSEREVRLIKAAARSKKCSISQYIYNVVANDLAYHAAKYEQVAYLIDQLEKIDTL